MIPNRMLRRATSNPTTAGVRTALVTLLALCSIGAAHPGSGIAVDSDGRVFFAAGPLIVMVEAQGGARVIVADRKNEKFYQLHHIQRAPGGGWLTASDIGNAIWRFTPDGVLTRFYPPPNQDRALSVGSGGDPFAVDDEGRVYAVNSVQDRFTQIIEVAPDGLIRVLAGGDWGYVDGLGTEARFGSLHGGSLVVAPDRGLLLTDDFKRVRRIASDGRVTTLAGGPDAGYVDGPGKMARFDGAAGLTLDREQNVIVVEQAGRIRRISPDGMVTTLAGTGRRGHRDAVLAEASFDEPTGICAAANGDLYVLEPGPPRIRKISGGRVTTIHEGLPEVR